MNEYGVGVLTQYGLDKMNKLNTLGQRLKLTTFVLGDGNGHAVVPNKDGENLVNQFASLPISIAQEYVLSGGVVLSPEFVKEHKGRWIREGGLLDEEGNLCVWVSYYPQPITQYINRTLTIALPSVTHDQTVIIETRPFEEVKHETLAALSGGNVVNRIDALGHSHIMVRIPMFTNKQCNDALGTSWQPESAPHPAFLKPDGTTIPWFEVGMYLCSGINLHIQTAPNAKPLMTTLEAARHFGQACGTGWHVLSSAEYSAIALLCLMKDATKQPQGNTYYGMSFDAKWQNGLRVDNKKPGETSSNSNPLTLTGTGPLEWRHNGDVTGIADLVGNELEWTDGLKLASRHNAIIVAQTNGAPEQDWITAAYFNAPEYNHGALSNRTPDIENLCNFSADPWRNMQKDADYSPVQLLQQLLVEPTTGSSLANGSAYFIASSAQEHYAARGGAWWAVTKSGLACLRLQHSHTDNRVFRVAYYE